MSDNETVDPTQPHVFEVDPGAIHPEYPDLCKVCGYSEKTVLVQHLAKKEPKTSSIQVYTHEYAENCFVISHFTGEILVGDEDLRELYSQLNQHLYPNKGFETELPVRIYPEKERTPVKAITEEGVVERIARALHDPRGIRFDLDAWDTLSEPTQTQYRSMAQVAVTTLKAIGITFDGSKES